ncbi:hypothetical protein SH528x_003455 [Novipirellula sp. SH528]|uniref:hypothetical protein n=1 Tax=Novipirellula sp. SH528 TaxID=3454466 RepID=UPI003FA0774F
MTRLTNETLAEQTAMFAGIAIMLIGLPSAVPGIAFATGFAMVFGGLAFSCFTSIHELDRQLRVRYTLMSTLVSVLVLGMTAWIVWDYTKTVASFLYTIGLAVLSFALVYSLARSWLSRHRKPSCAVDCEGTEQ